MKSTLFLKIVGVAIVLIGVGGASTFYIIDVHRRASPAIMIIGHTPAWYEAHRDALKIADKQCSENGTYMPAGFCENVSTADQAVSNQDAINALNQAGSSGK